MVQASKGELEYFGGFEEFSFKISNFNYYYNCFKKIK